MGDDLFEPPAELPRAQLHNKFGEKYKAAPPPPRPVVPSSYELPSQRKRGGFGSAGAIGVIAIAVVRAVMMVGHTSSSYDSYNYQIPNIPAYDPHMLEDLERQSQYLRGQHLYDPPPAVVPVPIAAGESPLDTKMELLTSLRELARPEGAGPAAQAEALGELQLVVLDDNCAQMIALQKGIGWLDAPPAPPPPPPPPPTDAQRQQIELIRGRIARLCPAKPTKPAKSAAHAPVSSKVKPEIARPLAEAPAP